MNNSLITLSPVETITETDLAWFIEFEGEQYWVPKSKCDIKDDELSIPEWLAIQKEMI